MQTPRAASAHAFLYVDVNLYVYGKYYGSEDVHEVQNLLKQSPRLAHLVGTGRCAGWTPLHTLSNSDTAQTDTMKAAVGQIATLLLQARVDAGAVNGKGRTCAHLAASRNHVGVLQAIIVQLGNTEACAYVVRIAIRGQLLFDFDFALG